MKPNILLKIIRKPAVCLVAVGLAAAVSDHGFAYGPGNPNPGVAPRHAEAFGKTYEEWILAFRQWQTGIPAARNPVLDETSQFCGEEQSGPVWFLASTLSSGTFERECHVPAGKALYVPLSGILVWLDGPADREAFSWVAETFLGLDPTMLSDEQLIQEFANWAMDSTTFLSLTVDGVAYDDLFSYRAESAVFDMEDTDLYDDLGIPYRHPNLSVTEGYSVLLNPLPNGPHTIEIHVERDNPLLGAAIYDITYRLWVGP